jgi:large subunit ribosomal protein L21
MYAIIRTGGKQSKVREGDVIDVERLRAEGEVTFTPLLLVDDKGKVISGRAELKTAKVTAKVLGETAGDKVEIFKYKAKTGYRRRGGHRQKYTTLEVVKIEGPKKAAAKKKVAEATEDAAEEQAEEPAAKKAPAKKPAAKKTTASKSSSTKKAPTKKAPTKKSSTKKSSSTKSSTKKES